MNQILVTQKLYITPELKRKKKIYKVYFFLSIFLVIVLISFYIYAEYDRNKSEEASQEILEEYLIDSENKNDNTVAKDDKVFSIVLDDEEEEKASKASAKKKREEELEKQRQQELEESNKKRQEEASRQASNQQSTQANNKTNQSTGATENTQSEFKTTDDGYKYKSIATINIPKINVNYAILEGETGSAEETDALLKISPCKFWGPNVNEVGNFCIVGHNWRNSKFFSKVPTLSIGDTFTITEPNVRTITYKIYDKYTVEPKNLSCTSQLTGGKKEVTLITCTDNGERRVIVKAKEVK